MRGLVLAAAAALALGTAGDAAGEPRRVVFPAPDPALIQSMAGAQSASRPGSLSYFVSHLLADAEASSEARSIANMFRLQGLERLDLVAAVNRGINAYRYVIDDSRFGAANYWALPSEFFRGRPGGDCEDISAVKFAVLYHLGVPASDMAIRVLQRDGQPHAVLLLAIAGRTLVLDNVDPKPRDIAEYSAGVLFDVYAGGINLGIDIAAVRGRAPVQQALGGR